MHSHTSQYGTISRSVRYFDIDPILREKMRATVEEIRSGAFARECSSDRAGKLEIIRMACAMQRALPFTAWEDRTRQLFRIGDAAEPTAAPAAAATSATDVLEE